VNVVGNGHVARGAGIGSTFRTVDPPRDWAQGKGGKDRVVFFDERALEAIRAYLAARGDTLLTIHAPRRWSRTPRGRAGSGGGCHRSRYGAS
jgi:hypothetical protein